MDIEGISLTGCGCGPSVSPSSSISSAGSLRNATQVHTCMRVVDTNILYAEHTPVQIGSRQSRPFVSVPLVTRSAATSSTVMQIGNPPTQLHRCSPNHACTGTYAAINVPTTTNSDDDEDDTIIEVH